MYIYIIYMCVYIYTYTRIFLEVQSDPAGACLYCIKAKLVWICHLHSVFLQVMKAECQKMFKELQALSGKSLPEPA